MLSHLHIIVNALGIVHIKDEHVLHSMHFTQVTAIVFFKQRTVCIINVWGCAEILPTLPCRWQVQRRSKAQKVHKFQHNCPLLLWFLSLRCYVILLRIASFVGASSLCHCFADTRSIFCFRFLPREV